MPTTTEQPIHVMNKQGRSSGSTALGWSAHDDHGMLRA